MFHYKIWVGCCLGPTPENALNGFRCYPLSGTRMGPAAFEWQPRRFWNSPECCGRLPTHWIEPGHARIEPAAEKYASVPGTIEQGPLHLCLKDNKKDDAARPNLIPGILFTCFE
jgi:hypothetical protein